MIVKLNNYTLNDPAGQQVYLDEDVLGLSLPAIRTSSGNYAGRNGGYIGGQFYGPRSITLQGRVFGTDVAALELKRREIQAALSGFAVTMAFTTYAGSAYVVYCNLVDFDMPIKRDKFEAPFKIELFAADPTIYDNATGTALTANVARRTSGGYTYPVVYPVIYAAGSGPTTVMNGGTFDVWPTATLTGQATNPVISNLTTGEFFGLNLNTAPGDVIVINMLARTVTLNGGSIFGLISANSVFWRLQPGGNDLSLTTSSGGDDVSGVVSWRSGFLGI